MASGVAFAQVDLTGVSVKAGGGIEGYTGELNNLTNVGPAWGVTVDVRPFRLMSMELAYTGAATEASEVVAPLDSGLISGPDILRNGGQAAVLIGLPMALQPYGLVGIGFDYYSVREETGAFSSDASGSVPLGVGIRGNTDRFTADLRFTYNAMFGDSFAGQGDNDFGDGRYATTLHVGGRF